MNGTCSNFFFFRNSWHFFCCGSSCYFALCKGIWGIKGDIIPDRKSTGTTSYFAVYFKLEKRKIYIFLSCKKLKQMK